MERADALLPARRALRAFAELDGTEWELSPHGAGRIHRTWAVVPSAVARRPAGAIPVHADERPAAEPSFLVQELNRSVFPDYEAVMRNAALISRTVTAALDFLPSRDGTLYHSDAEGRVFRLVRFVAGSVPASIPPPFAQAREVALAFGEFDADLATLPPAAVTPTIPGFHDTPARYRALESVCKRVASADAESSGEASRRRLDAASDALEWLAARRSRLGFIADRLGSSEVPLRVCHNDTKADNVLLDRRTRRRICVVDYDTVMPGSPLYDVGDLLRSAAPTVGEDHANPGDVDVRWDVASEIVGGFLAGAGRLLTGTERDLARASGWLLAVEQGIRYLTDHLDGDRYYGVEYAGQNLDRARNQIAVATAFERSGWSPR